MNNSQLINQDSGSVEWYTPWKIIEAAREIMGGIDLDPFSCERANNRPEGKIAPYWFESDGDIRSWWGNVWMNHPFSREMNKAAIEKVCFEYLRIGGIRQACCITFASTSEKWFKPLSRHPQFYFTGRVNYLNGETLKPIKGVPKGSVITFFRPSGMSYFKALTLLEDTFIKHGFEGVAK